MQSSIPASKIPIFSISPSNSFSNLLSHHHPHISQHSFLASTPTLSLSCTSIPSHSYHSISSYLPLIMSFTALKSTSSLPRLPITLPPLRDPSLILPPLAAQRPRVGHCPLPPFRSLFTAIPYDVPPPLHNVGLGSIHRSTLFAPTMGLLISGESQSLPELAGACLPSSLCLRVIRERFDMTPPS